jgi:radical SAM-linked protein
MQFISHLDLIRLFERALRRANIPIQYTEGYNPKAKIIFALPLPVGVISYREYVDFFLSSPVPLLEFKQNLNGHLPEGIKILEAYSLLKISQKNPLPTLIGYVLFKISFKKNLPQLKTSVKKFLQAKECWVMRKGKGKERKINIRPLVLKMQVSHHLLWVVLEKKELSAKIKEILNEGLAIPSSFIETIERRIFFKKEREKLNTFLLSPTLGGEK